MADKDEERQSPVKAVKSWIGRIGRVRAWIVGIVLGLGAVAAALTQIHGLATTVFPALKQPDPPTERSASLDITGLDPGVTLKDYIKRPEVPPRAAEDAVNLSSEEQLEMVGDIVYFGVELKGDPQKEYYLRWSVYDTNTGKTVDGLANRSAWPSDEVTPRSQVSGRQLETWIPLPQKSESEFFARIELYTIIDEQEVPLDSGRVEIGTGEGSGNA